MQFSSEHYKAQKEEVKKQDAINRGSSVSIKPLNRKKRFLNNGFCSCAPSISAIDRMIEFLQLTLSHWLIGILQVQDDLNPT